jgi:hypothetical protein
MNREYKYNIGDVVVIKHLRDKVGVILQKDYFARSGDDKIGVPGYKIMISGIENKTFVYYEHEIEKL